jgi:hypothetical protein
MTNIVRLPNAFDQARRIEERGKQRLAPWLTQESYDGRWVWIAKSGLALLLQKTAGDALVSVDQFGSYVLEMKFLEKSHDAPFEVYSNRVLMPDGTPDRINSKRGWGLTCNADLIGIYCLSYDSGVVGRLPAWKAMLNERMESGLRRWQLYDKREQTKRRQRNSSWVIWTPYADLERHANFRRFSAMQLELMDRGPAFQ